MTKEKTIEERVEHIESEWNVGAAWTLVFFMIMISGVSVLIYDSYQPSQEELTNATINEIFERYGVEECVEWKAYQCQENITIFMKVENQSKAELLSIDINMEFNCYGKGSEYLQVFTIEDNKTEKPYYKFENSSHSICTKYIETATLTREVN